MAPKPYFALQNFHGHAKEFLQNLYTIWARALKKARQPWSSPLSTVDLVALKFQAHEHPHLVTSPHPAGPSASSLSPPLTRNEATYSTNSLLLQGIHRQAERDH